MTDKVDLLVVGGGINGAGVARDAAGRGLSVLLCEKGDLGEGTSSRSGKYIHGGLRYLEYFEFRLVREALIEREILLKMAPHIIFPMRLVITHNKGLRPAWMLRAGLFLYDHLGGRERLPGTRAVELHADPVGEALKPHYTKAFEYSDCWVDDARLVLCNALSAAEAGATVLTRTAFTGARRDGDAWLAELTDQANGEVRTLRARAIVNAAGPWVEQALSGIEGVRSNKRVRLVKGSHIITKKFWDGPQAYVIQHTDRRILFINPYLDDLALIGTTDVSYQGDPGHVQAEPAEIAYMCDAVNAYFRHRLTPDQVMLAYSGVRPLLEDEAENPSAVTRDYEFECIGEPGEPVLLSVYGGKITTYRKLAEHALERLRPWFPTLGPAWSGMQPLPGGDMPGADYDRSSAAARAPHAGMPVELLRHLARLYGTRIDAVIGDARTPAQLGRHFGAQCYERELVHLLDNEWAETAEDLLWRRTKHWLRLDEAQRAAVAQWLQARPLRRDAAPRAPARAA